MTKKYYGVAVNGVFIRANSKEEAERIFTNKFTDNQLEFAGVHLTGTVYDSGDLEEIRHLGHVHWPECMSDTEMCIDHDE